LVWSLSMWPVSARRAHRCSSMIDEVVGEDTVCAPGAGAGVPAQSGTSPCPESRSRCEMRPLRCGPGRPPRDTGRPPPTPPGHRDHAHRPHPHAAATLESRGEQPELVSSGQEGKCHASFTGRSPAQAAALLSKAALGDPEFERLSGDWPTPYSRSDREVAARAATDTLIGHVILWRKPYDIGRGGSPTGRRGTP
jgi:hypothetical protein